MTDDDTSPLEPALVATEAAEALASPPSFADYGVAPARLTRLAAQGIVTPSPIQALALPVIMAGRDALVAAQTGSGKTLAYMLPALARLEADHAGGAIKTSAGAQAASPLLLVLVPTQELGMQVREVARGLLAGSSFRVVELIGGANPQRQVEQLKQGADVVVGTAGRIVDMMTKSRLSLARLQVVVLDEADQLADGAHRADVTAVLTAANAARQVIAASATLSPEARKWAAGFMKDPADLTAETSLQMPRALCHQAIVADQRDQLPLLRKLLHALNPTGAIAFFNVGADIDWLVGKLRHHGVRAAGMHAGVDKIQRANAMRDFRAGKLQLLVATELAARGLDLGGVTLVFNLDLPRAPEHYVHRVGRTARMGRAGTAITFAAPAEEWVLGKFEKALGITFERPVYTFGELRAPTPEDQRREAKKAKGQARHEADKQVAKRLAVATAEAKEQGLAPPPQPAKAKKKQAKAAAKVTAAKAAKGKARKAERLRAGTWKPAQKKPAGAGPSGGAPEQAAPPPKPPTAEPPSP